jgi:anti-sigma B factor antagonist
MTPLALSCEDLPTATIIRVSGQVDATNRADLAAVLAPGQRRDCPLILDLGGMTFLDSSGLQVLIRAHNHDAGQGRKLFLASLHSGALRLLEITGLLSHFHIYPTVEQALTAAEGAREDLSSMS